MDPGKEVDGPEAAWCNGTSARDGGTRDVGSGPANGDRGVWLPCWGSGLRTRGLANNWSIPRADFSGVMEAAGSFSLLGVIIQVVVFGRLKSRLVAVSETPT